MQEFVLVWFPKLERLQKAKSKIAHVFNTLHCMHCHTMRIPL